VKRGSLQQRLLAVVLLSAIPVFAVHVGVQIFSDIRTASARATANTQDIAAAAIPLLQSTLVVGDLAASQETLDNIMRHGQFRSLRLLAPTGSTLLAEGHPGRPVAGSETPAWFARLLDFHFPPQEFAITVGGTAYGTLLVEPSSIFLVADIWQRMWTALALWLTTTIVLLSLLKITLRRGLQPLHDLAETARQFGNGDLECRAPLGNVPELAATAQAFNRMAENLAEAQDRLEARVIQRTLELSASEARTSAILANLQDGVVQTDSRGMILSVNAAICRLFGYRDKDMLGANIRLLLPELDAFPPSAAPVGDPGQRFDVAGRRSDGGRFSLDLSIRELDYDNGSIWIGVLRDISQQKQVEAAREAARANAEALAQAKSEFLANMSHEIRTPLNAMLGLAQVGQRKSRGAPIERSFEKILQAGDLLLRLINDILDFSKIEAHKMPIESVPFALGAVIDNAVDITAPRAFARDLAFTVSEQPGLPGTCIGDPVRISQILVNLLSNAVKFTQHGSISLDVGRTAHRLLFRINDTGMGMSQEVQGRLFEPFEQADSSITRRFGGTGLGLIICRRLLNLMQGEISIDSQPGRGTRIEVSLPLQEAADARPPALSCPPLRLCGLTPEEENGLARRPGETAAPADIEAADSLPERPVARLLVIDAGLAASAHEALHALSLGGQKIAVIYTPGVEHGVPEDLAARCLHLDRPLRRRVLLETLQRDLEHPRHDPCREEGARLTGIRILAAEDDAPSRLVLREILDLEGASPVIEDNGEAACERLSMAGPRAFDIVVTDIQMPRLDGYATARRVGKLAPGLPVIGLSAHALPEERERCLAAGMVDLVTKPVAIDALVAAILRQLRPGATRPPPSATPTRSAPDTPIDWDTLAGRFNHNHDFIRQLLATVVESHAGSSDALREAARQGGFGNIAAVSHKVAGMARNIEAGELAALALACEAAARREDGASLAQAHTLADMLDRILARLAGPA